jgi:ferrous iron transport protein B
VQVGDAKNLRRTLTLTALLAELGVPLVLALNMHDEAAARGVTVDIRRWPKNSASRRGHRRHRRRRHRRPARQPGHARCRARILHYDKAIEADIERVVGAAITRLAPTRIWPPRGLAILYLGGDAEVAAWLRDEGRHRLLRKSRPCARTPWPGGRRPAHPAGPRAHRGRRRAGGQRHPAAAP